MANNFSEDEWRFWMDELSIRNYIVFDNFLDDELYQLTKSFFSDKLELFKHAGVGSKGDHQIKKTIRGDLTFWLNPERDTELDKLWMLIQELRRVLNRYCFLSLSGFEVHLAHYPPGSFYGRHLDQFQNKNNRMISMIMYLNDQWQNGDGGELELVLDNDVTKLVEPIAKRCVLFKSKEMFHSVLKANKSRYSLTGWFLYNPAIMRDFLSP